MREMKESEIEWLGQIPRSWRTEKIKQNFEVVSGSTPASTNPLFWDGNITWVTPADFKTNDHWIYKGARNISQNGYKSCNTKMIPAGSIIFSKRAPVGNVVIAKASLCTNQGCLSCIPSKDVNVNYFYYVMSILNEQFELVSAGTTFKEISLTRFKNFKLPVPKLLEQQAIADYLDAKCAELDALQQDIEKEIEALKAYKNSLITQAVTKGLDSHVEMKDSGVEWIGKIPKHWNAIKFKYTVSIVRGGSPRPINQYLTDSDEGYNWIRIGDTTKGDKYIRTTKLKIIKAGLSNTRFVKKDTLLLTNSMSYGEPYILDLNGCIHDGWLAFSNYKNVDKLFLYYSLMSENMHNQFSNFVSGSVVVNLNIEKVKNSYMTLPPLDEQQAIVKYLDIKSAEIEAIIASKQKQSEILSNYKKSLIYEVVTGKKEVPVHE